MGYVGDRLVINGENSPSVCREPSARILKRPECFQASWSRGRIPTRALQKPVEKSLAITPDTRSGPGQRERYAGAVVGRCVRRRRASTAAVDLKDEAVDARIEGDVGHDQRAGFAPVGEDPGFHWRPDEGGR